MKTVDHDSEHGGCGASASIRLGLRVITAVGILATGAAVVRAQVVIDFDGLPAPHNLLAAP